MMKICDFMEYVRMGEIPPAAPDYLTLDGFDLHFYAITDKLKYWESRRECTERGMWAIVEQRWIRHLAEWIGDRLALEIMCGAGWLAKALNQHGIKIIATDSDPTWGGRHSQARPVFPIQNVDAVEAVNLFPTAEVLICSWPPYGEMGICEAAEAWGAERPIVYIGENDGGCNAPEKFFAHFQELNDAPDIALFSWSAIHDDVFIGQWVP